MLKNTRDKIKAFICDTSGSDTIEMIYSTAAMVAFILVGLVFFTYLVELNQCNTATKRVVREIEVTGEANASRMDSTFDYYMGGGRSISNKKVKISGVSYISGRRIQLMDVFTVTGSCDYRLTLMNPGNYSGFTIDIPIVSRVSGMSEVYWRPSRGYAQRAT